jgi:2-methylcitrate dehydratase PrpD
LAHFHWLFCQTLIFFNLKARIALPESSLISLHCSRNIRDIREKIMKSSKSPGAFIPCKETWTSRRNVLRGMSLAAAGAAIPFRFAHATDSVSPAMTKLSTYMSEAGSRQLPDDVIEVTKHHVLDTLSAVISGSKLPAGVAALGFARMYGGEKISTVAASNVVCGPIEAALANAEMAHADETDDSHAPSLSHPGCSVVPASLAMAEKFGVDGAHFLRAVALGYDVGTRITMTMGTATIAESHRDTHSIVALFGSAAAAASLAGLNPQQMRWVLDYATQQAAGTNALYRDSEHVEKAFVFAGVGARGGVTAALLVYSGWTGIEDILSGPDNLMTVYNPQSDPAGFVDKLGERYEVTRTNIKKWSVGSPIQAPLDALVILQKKHPFNADQVQQVVVKTYDTNAVNDREIPDINIQYMVAVMLLDKTASFKSAHDKNRMQDPDILRQRAKVKFVFDEDLKKHMPDRAAIVEVTLTDGTQLSEYVHAVRGTQQNPMTRDEVVAKARDLMAPVLGEGNCSKLIDKVLALETVKNVRELRPLLQVS